MRSGTDDMVVIETQYMHRGIVSESNETASIEEAVVDRESIDQSLGCDDSCTIQVGQIVNICATEA